MGKIQQAWTGQDRDNLIKMDIEQLMVEYPDQSRENLGRRKREVLQKLREDGIPVEVSKNEYIENGNLVSETNGTWQVGAYNHDTKEWDIATLTRRSVKTTPVPQGLEAVEVAKIRYDRRRARRTGAKTLLVFGDAQMGYRRIGDRMEPLHDIPAMKATLGLARNLQPDVLVDLGDDIDLAEMSRFAPDSTHFQNTLKPSMQANHDWHAELTQATPGAERHLVDSNHAKRFGDYILKNAPVLGELPELKLHRLLRLEEIGWQFHGGYGSAEYEYADDLAFKHGTIATAAGSTANKLSKDNPDRHIVQGHAHRMESQWRTDRRGHQFGAFVVGCLCRIDGIVPSYHSGIDHNDEPVKHYENWQQGIMVVRDYGNGEYTFDQVPISKGRLLYEGQLYDGNE